jgi:aldehyde:ferredoxin oxidoreductase
VKAAAQKIGRRAEQYAIHIQGQEVPGHNPLASINVTTTYITNATPARHTQGSEEHHSEGLLPRYDRKVVTGRAPLHVRGSNFQHALMACGMCLFVNMTLPHVDVMAEFISAVTGWDVTTEELVLIGERIANIRQAFNIREGLNPREFAIPGRILGRPPHTVGPLAGKTVDAETMVKEYLTIMDWDLKTAKPSKQKLISLGLDDAAMELWP